MPSQAEVFQAAKDLGYWFTYRRLKKYFGMEKFTGERHGSSNLSARVKKLHEKGYLMKFKVPGGVIYIVPPEHWDISRADEFLHYARQSSPRERGTRLDPEILQRVQNALYDEKQSTYVVARRVGIHCKTAKRYLEALVEMGIINKANIDGVDYYTVYDTSLLN